jgi:hypothetical protein
MKSWCPLLFMFLVAAGIYWIHHARPAGQLPGAGPVLAQNSAAPPSTPRPASDYVGLRDPAQAPGQATPAATTPYHPPAAPPARVSPLPPELAALPAATILENVRTDVRLYGSTFGGNPVGTNPEITKALQGDNPKHLNFLKPDGNRVNANGELVDPWGTPYFFHQLSALDMEIRSAGPDRVLWTADDLVTR